MKASTERSELGVGVDAGGRGAGRLILGVGSGLCCGFSGSKLLFISGIKPSLTYDKGRQVGYGMGVSLCRISVINILD